MRRHVFETSFGEYDVMPAVMAEMTANRGQPILAVSSRQHRMS
jgi:hypothetical protein